MSDSELDKLIVANIVDLEATATRIPQIENRIWNAISETVEAMTVRSGWGADLAIDDDICAYPVSWVSDEQSAAWFAVGNGVHDDEAGRNYDLTWMVGADGGQTCLWFGHRIASKQWKPLFRKYAEELQAAGFSMTAKGAFYIDFTSTPAEMAVAVEQDDFNVPMARLSAALDKAWKAEPKFTRMLSELNMI